MHLHFNASKTRIETGQFTDLNGFVHLHVPELDEGRDFGGTGGLYWKGLVDGNN
jgi:hypothetical protein